MPSLPATVLLAVKNVNQSFENTMTPILSIGYRTYKKYMHNSLFHHEIGVESESILSPVYAVPQQLKTLLMFCLICQLYAVNQDNLSNS